MDQSSKPKTIKNEVDTPPSFIALRECSKSCNLSFSFNFDLDDVSNNDSSDSENADLQIDVSEIDNHGSPSKHKRDTIEETSSVINEMEEEIERQLDAKAAKTNLTATNVKNILKHVITNEHVMAMVQKRLQNNEDDMFFEPKLTRAKAKELAAAQVNIPWPITPMKKTSSEVQVLIEQELPEDSSDEEYNPEQDKQSDDDREAENCTNSDLDSQPSTPVIPHDLPSFEQPKSLNVQYDPEGIFKIPGIPHVPTEEESIGQRTRSKLCLSETPLEQIEQAFIPPDITTDMYDWDCEVDEDWDNFLKEFTQPLTQEPAIEDDPEADPEYNILEDEETDFLDKEELRADKAVKVTRKELNNLIAELFEFTDTFSEQDQEFSRKKKCLDNATLSIENDTLNCSTAGLLPVSTELELPQLLNSEQRHLVSVQLRQHIQLMVQHFAMTYMHPDLHSQSTTCKQNLNSIRYLNNGQNSVFNATNLSEAFKLISDWEDKFLNDQFRAEYKKTITDDDAINKIYSANKWKYNPEFHPELKKLFVESKALMYPQLLPETPFRNEVKRYIRSPYLKCEENLLALGLEQFIPFIASKPRKFKSKKLQLMDAVQLITQFLVPCRVPQGVFYHIQKRRCAKDSNPIKHYFEKGCAPRIIHYITLECDPKAPKDQPINLLPLKWQTFLNNTEQKIDLLKRKHILNSYNVSMKKDYNTSENDKNNADASDTSCLYNKISNILPKTLSTSTDEKSSTEHSKEHNVEDINRTSDSGINTVVDNSEIVHERCAPHQSSPLKPNSVIVSEEEKVKSTNTTMVEEKSKGDIPINSVTTRSSKLPKKSEITQELPQLRRTTPRLAKTKSAQNMKLMAQVLGPKCLSSNYNALKSKEKHNLDTNLQKSSMISKVDNEEEIAELMLASTTIKKDALSRKKAKAAREMENIKRLLESENPMNEEERASKFAAWYLQKLHLTLETNNPETFKAVIKLYLDYNEKLDGINQTEGELSFSNTPRSQNEEKTTGIIKDKDTIAIDLYRDMCEKLEEYPDLCSDFLLFLKPHQAAMIDKSIEYIMLQKMSEFINVAQIYFAKQPSRIAKIMQAITQLSSDPHIALESVYTIMNPILRGHPLVMDLFLQILPTAKPPESLFASHMFENLTCPLGPHDKNKSYTDDAIELYENVELPVLSFQEDPYGGENCRCCCHTGDDPSLKNISEHCLSCGTRFLNGRIYVQTSEGLRPAKIIFPGADKEKLENIARVSLKMANKFGPTPSRKRRKPTKNESHHDDILYEKHFVSKNTSFKDSEDAEKAAIKLKKLKSPLKSEEQKKAVKRLGSNDNTDVNNKKIRVSQSKNKRERNPGRQDLKLGCKSLRVMDHVRLNEGPDSDSGSQLKEVAKNAIHVETKVSNKSVDSNETDSLNNIKNSGGNIDVDIKNCKPWTRQEDMILLQSIKKDYSEHSLTMISETLENRSLDQVKERCHTLLSLLEKMT